MNANHLLLWMSARQQGSWIQFKSAVEDLQLADREQDFDQVNFSEHDTIPGLPYHQLLRFNLQTLAHAEFFAKRIESGWSVVPPSLAIRCQSERWVGVLCGARSPQLLEKLEEPLPAYVETQFISRLPDQFILVATSKEILLEAARKLDLYVQLDAPIAILLNLPPITHPIFRRKVQMPFGRDWITERFSISSSKWKESTIEEAIRSKGDLFHLSIGYRHQYLFCYKGESYEVNPRTGKYLSLIRRVQQVIRYDRNTQTFLVPAPFRPPILIERAFNLCTGLPASFDSSSGLLIYVGIPEDIAHYAATLLRQEMIK